MCALSQRLIIFKKRVETTRISPLNGQSINSLQSTWMRELLSEATITSYHINHTTHFGISVFISIIFWPSVLNVTKKSAVDPLAANFLNVKIKDTMFKGTKQLGHSAVSQKMPICWPYKPAIYTPPRGLHGRDCGTNKPSESL